MSELLTLQDLANGHLDVKALGEAANGDENTVVTTRTGNTYPSAERAIKTMFQNGGLPAEAFETYAKMQLDGASLADGKYAAVTNDDDKTKNGIYLKKTGVWVQTGYGKSDVDKEYIDIRSADLFAKSTEAKFSDANLVVTRYLTTGGATDYAAGTYQTPMPDGLKIVVPASGSNAIAHYFRTGLVGFNNVSATFTISLLNSSQGDGFGLGFIDDLGKYVMYLYSTTGVIRKVINQSQVSVITANLPTAVVGDTLKVEVKTDKVLFYKNNVLTYTHDIGPADSINGRQVIFGQLGFSQYIVNMTANSDPIRDYVDKKVSEVNPSDPIMVINPLLYYQFNKTGGVHSAGVMTVYTQIKDNSYVGFEIVHEVDMRDIVYQDYWRIYRADFYTLTDATMVATGKKALDTGESEFVFKQNANKIDFTGGYHGDELATDINFLANGLPVSLSVNIPLTACDSFEYIEKSTMHETANKDSDPFVAGHPIVANHVKNTSFYNGGYKTYNKIIFNYAGTMSTLYHGIACISKDVAATVIGGLNFNAQAMTGSGLNYFEEVKPRDYIGYNTANKLSVKATSKIIDNSAADIASTFFVHDRTTDSKYYRKSPPKNVVVGEVMESEFSCFFDKS